MEDPAFIACIMYISIVASRILVSSFHNIFSYLPGWNWNGSFIFVFFSAHIWVTRIHWLCNPATVPDPAQPVFLRHQSPGFVRVAGIKSGFPAVLIFRFRIMMRTPPWLPQVPHLLAHPLLPHLLPLLLCLLRDPDLFHINICLPLSASLGKEKESGQIDYHYKKANTTVWKWKLLHWLSCWKCLA